jgi:hypothetical protein
MKAAKNLPATAPHANAARNMLPVPTAQARQKPWHPHKHMEKRTIAGAVTFIAALVVGGVIYSGMATGPPEKPASEAFVPHAPARIARIMLPGTGPLCREILFDNDTGYFSLEKTVPCNDTGTTQPKSLGGSGGGGGFSSFKGAFGR